MSDELKGAERQLAKLIRALLADAFPQGTFRNSAIVEDVVSSLSAMMRVHAGQLGDRDSKKRNEQALELARVGGAAQVAAEFMTYDGLGVCPYCRRKAEDLASGGEGVGNDPDPHYASCPWAKPSVMRYADARAEGKDAGLRAARAELLDKVDAIARSVTDKIDTIRRRVTGLGVSEDGAEAIRLALDARHELSELLRQLKGPT